jgi:hypothetical protein
MGEFWRFFKLAVLVWGFVCLAIVLFVVGSIMMKDHSYKQEAEQQAQVDTSYKKTVGNLKVVVSKDSSNQERLSISIYRNENPLVKDYELPMAQFDLGWLNVEDVLIYPGGGGSYRIVLLTTNTESDHDTLHDYIWMLKLDKVMSFDRMIDLSDFHKMPNNETIQYGSREIYLPGFEGEEYLTISIPVEVVLGQTIRVKPLLSRPNLDEIKRHYSKVIESRLDKLVKMKDEEMVAKYRNFAKELQDTAVESEYPAH